ncbi:hypothetical protein FH972_017322 [Carpinus fangiana]|uniref:Uncharacterized protein n=1 Tax=Carpinus fangiana TaxID=176857 RepID=A0A5N6RIV2_9ROSI|nr:hypothetical protein FH972_017322 [Carpinus fangiana]
MEERSVAIFNEKADSTDHQLDNFSSELEGQQVEGNMRIKWVGQNGGHVAQMAVDSCAKSHASMQGDIEMETVEVTRMNMEKSGVEGKNKMSKGWNCYVRKPLKRLKFRKRREMKLE